MSAVRSHKETFGELLNTSDPRDIQIFIPCQSHESVLYVLLDVCAFNYEDLTLCGRGGNLILINPNLICVIMILRDLLCLWKRFESAFLEPPPLPVVVTSCNDLIVILGVETHALDCLPVGLLGEIEMSNHSV